MKGLTERQLEILHFIETFMEEEGRAPTLRETGTRFGISPAGVHYTYRVLEEKGVLQIAEGRSRGVTLPLEERNRKENVRIPFYSSEPSPEELEKDAPETTYIQKGYWQEGVFAFRVTSSSMTNGGILPGDMAFLKRTTMAKEGDIVLASVSMEEEEAMELRRYHQSGKSIELWSENDTMGIIRSQNVRICGILFETRRSY